MPVSLHISNLTKTYGSGEDAVYAVRDASLAIDSGEFVAIVGPSGSGKTTLIAMIGALLRPTSGRIEIDGQDIATLKGRAQALHRRTAVGYVFQANNLVSYLTTRENLMLVQQISGGDRHAAAARADRLMAELGLEKRANALAAQLSGGERQRVAIARALMNEPKLVLVDEPTASLDSSRGRQVVESLVAEVKGRGKLGIMVTHDLAMAALADRVLEMHDGRLTEIARGEQQPVASA
jgi:putative ABC transport system ATP-binding protein